MLSLGDLYSQIINYFKFEPKKKYIDEQTNTSASDVTSASDNSDDNDLEEEIIQNNLNNFTFNNDTDEQVSETLIIPSQSQLSLQTSTSTSTTVSMSQDDDLDTCSICLQRFQRGRGMAIHRSSCLKKNTL